MANKIVTVIKASDYDRLKNFGEIELVVEAKNRKPMKIFASVVPSTDKNKSYYTGYENAVFNGECD